MPRHRQFWHRLIPDDSQGGEEVQTAQTSDSGGYEPVDILPGTGELLSTTIDYAYDPLPKLPQPFRIGWVSCDGWFGDLFLDTHFTG